VRSLQKRTEPGSRVFQAHLSTHQQPLTLVPHGHEDPSQRYTQARNQVRRREEHHIKEADDAKRQPKRLQRQQHTYTQAPGRNPQIPTSTQGFLPTSTHSNGIVQVQVHKRQVITTPAHTTPPRPGFLLTACVPTSNHSNGFCVI
jgi:hypothetical protein